MKAMNLLVTVDANYLRHAATMLASLRLNGGPGNYNVYLVHSDIADTDIDEIATYCARLRMRLIPARLHKDDFADAPVTAYYSKAMYYRLLASKILPGTLDKILYLDPDILIINSIDGLYGTDMGSALFAAAAHTGLTDIAKHVNRIRLGTPEAQGYFNSGVMLMNLKEQRGRIKEQDIFDYVRANEDSLILPDQDVLNALYSDAILP
ncbi:glycosyltransferase family 8 protein, partial [Desulfovibrio sp. OttesenSCG-928-M16]|nr:glycosyltransferase family 8 protein [Desulfovibrio sp. OttesenSCG-928-M16]